MINDKIGSVYALVDPRYFDLERYCGQTTIILKQRLKGHVKGAIKSFNNNLKDDWIRKLASLDLKPKIVLLAHNIRVPFITYLQNDFAKNRFRPFYDYDALDKEEIYFIECVRKQCESHGVKCVNSNKGGHGDSSQHINRTGRKESEEHKRKQQETANKPEVLEANRKRNSGSLNPMFGKSLKNYMTPEKYELWKKHTGEGGKRSYQENPERAKNHKKYWFLVFIESVKFQIIEWT